MVPNWWPESSNFEIEHGSVNHLPKKPVNHKTWLTAFLGMVDARPVNHKTPVNHHYSWVCLVSSKADWAVSFHTWCRLRSDKHGMVPWPTLFAKPYETYTKTMPQHRVRVDSNRICEICNQNGLRMQWSWRETTCKHNLHLWIPSQHSDRSKFLWTETVGPYSWMHSQASFRY